MKDAPVFAHTLGLNDRSRLTERLAGLLISAHRAQDTIDTDFAPDSETVAWVIEHLGSGQDVADMIYIFGDEIAQEVD